MPTLAFALLPALLCSAAALFLRLSRQQYQQYRHAPPSLSTPSASPTPDAPPQPQSSVKLVFIPSFQGTLLQNAQSSLPLFLAPLSRADYPSLYRLLQSRSTHIVRHPHAVEYAATTCHSYRSHFSHCLTLPAKGAVAQLSQKYRVQSVPYDWRQSKRTILRTASAQHLTHALTCHDCLVLAHGSACPLLRVAIDNLQNVSATTACIAPISTHVANLTAMGHGLMCVGDAHKFSDCMSTVRHARIQYASMAAELGMLSGRNRRSYIPDVSGVDFDQQPMVPVLKRRALVAAFDAVEELASGGRAVLDFCVEGSGFHVAVRGVSVDGDGVVERGACERVARRVLSVHAHHLHLVQLVDAVVEQLALAPLHKFTEGNPPGGLI